MLARTQLDQLIRLSARASILLGILFLVTVLLAAMPGHRVPAAQSQESQQASSQQSQQTQQMDPNMPGMDMDDAKANEAHAVHDMTPGHHDTQSAHLRMTNLPQPEYHFTNYMNGFLEAFTFNPARPTSLLYKKTSSGYELVGAMYTMPKNATENQLNARIPLSVAMWHLHTNLCMPEKGHARNADWSKFGLGGTIASQEACDAAGGRFHPVIFGWMVHVYPYEGSQEKIFAMHHHD